MRAYSYLLRIRLLYARRTLDMLGTTLSSLDVIGCHVVWDIWRLL